MPDALDGRCGACARFVRVVDAVGPDGRALRAGQCLLGVWPSPLYETSTCSQWVKRGQAHPGTKGVRNGGGPAGQGRARRSLDGAPGRIEAPVAVRATAVDLLENIVEMHPEEFRRVLSEVIREELGLSQPELSGKWAGGEVVLRPGKEGLQEKRIPIDSLFHKIVMIRDRLRVLEQRINSHPGLGDQDKIQLQQYVTGCYGSLTTFNVLFALRDDQFVGQKGDE